MYTRDSIAVLWSKFFFGNDSAWINEWKYAKNWMHDNFELFNMHIQEDGSIKNHLNGKIVHFRSILIFSRDKEWGINSSRRCLFNGLKTFFYHREKFSRCGFYFFGEKIHENILLVCYELYWRKIFIKPFQFRNDECWNIHAEKSLSNISAQFSKILKKVFMFHLTRLGMIECSRDFLWIF